MKLRFTDYGGGAGWDELSVYGIKDGTPGYYLPRDVMPMVDAGEEDEEGWWTIASKKLGRITFQSIDIEEDR